MTTGDADPMSVVLDTSKYKVQYKNVLLQVLAI